MEGGRIDPYPVRQSSPDPSTINAQTAGEAKRRESWGITSNVLSISFAHFVTKRKRETLDGPLDQSIEQTRQTTPNPWTHVNAWRGRSIEFHLTGTSTWMSRVRRFPPGGFHESRSYSRSRIPFTLS